MRNCATASSFFSCDLYAQASSYRTLSASAYFSFSFSNASKVPLRVLIQDLLIHEDAFPNFIPNVVPRMDNVNFDASVRDEEMLEVDRLELDVELTRIGWGLDRIGVKEWVGYEPALRATFSRAGWDLSRFRAYRCYVRYPFPFVSLTTWFDLPPAP